MKSEVNVFFFFLLFGEHMFVERLHICVYGFLYQCYQRSGMLAHAYNHRCSGGRDQEDHSMCLACAKC
jgi:hypothetical protein